MQEPIQIRTSFMDRFLKEDYFRDGHFLMTILAWMYCSSAGFSITGPKVSWAIIMSRMLVGYCHEQGSRIYEHAKHRVTLDWLKLEIAALTRATRTVSDIPQFDGIAAWWSLLLYADQVSSEEKKPLLKHGLAAWVIAIVVYTHHELIKDDEQKLGSLYLPMICFFIAWSLQVYSSIALYENNEVEEIAVSMALKDLEHAYAHLTRIKNIKNKLGEDSAIIILLSEYIHPCSNTLAPRRISPPSSIETAKLMQ